MCLQLVVLRPPPLVIKGESDNPQQTPSVMNVKAAYFRQSRIPLPPAQTNQYVAVSILHQFFKANYFKCYRSLLAIFMP